MQEEARWQGKSFVGEATVFQAEVFALEGAGNMLQISITIQSLYLVTVSLGYRPFLDTWLNPAQCSMPLRHLTNSG